MPAKPRLSFGCALYDRTAPLQDGRVRLPNYDIDMREWVTFARAAEADRDDGLVFVDAPMTEVIR